jgi:GNAT superfamily N-acetyltransferase
VIISFESTVPANFNGKMKLRVEIHPAGHVAPEQREAIEEWWLRCMNVQKFKILKKLGIRAVVRKLSRAPKLQRLVQQRQEWFQNRLGYIPYQWTTPDWHMLAYVEDGLTGHLGVVERRVVTVSGQLVQVSGVCGMITRPEWRRRGIATAMLERAVAFIRDEVAAEFCVLFSSEEVAALYARFGWKRVEGPTTFQQAAERMTFSGPTMVLSCRGKEWPEGSIDLCGLPW